MINKKRIIFFTVFVLVAALLLSELLFCKNIFFFSVTHDLEGNSSLTCDTRACHSPAINIFLKFSDKNCSRNQFCTNSESCPTDICTKRTRFVDFGGPAEMPDGSHVESTSYQEYCE